MKPLEALVWAVSVVLMIVMALCVSRQSMVWTVTKWTLPALYAGAILVLVLRRNRS